MSNIYNLEPQAHGLIILKTTFGDLEVELFTQQCPLATRNFVQLCFDGYYNGTIFNRVEKDFIAVGGIAPEDDNQIKQTFSDEFHSRLKFSRRGLLATANTKKDANGPEFFFTLGPAPELQNKHTIFGRLKGNSVYCLVDLNECQVDDDLFPLSEKKIIETVIVDNPYPDLVARKEFARYNRAKKKTQSEEYNDLLNKPKNHINKSKKLSFYQDSDEDEEVDEKSARKHDDEPKRLNEKFDLKLESEQKEKYSSTAKQSEQSETKRIKLEKGECEGEAEVDAREKRLREIRAQIQEIKKQIEGESDSKRLSARSQGSRQSEEGESKSNLSIQSQPDSEEAKVAPRRGQDRERETMELVQKFKKKLKEKPSADLERPDKDAKIDEQKVETNGTLDLELDFDDFDKVDGDAWLQHKFEADDEPGLAKDANTKGDDWYPMEDPRNPMTRRIESDRSHEYRKLHHSRRDKDYLADRHQSRRHK